MLRPGQGQGQGSGRARCRGQGQAQGQGQGHGQDQGRGNGHGGQQRGDVQCAPPVAPPAAAMRRRRLMGRARGCHSQRGAPTWTPLWAPTPRAYLQLAASIAHVNHYFWLLININNSAASLDTRRAMRGCRLAPPPMSRAPGELPRARAPLALLPGCMACRDRAKWCGAGPGCDWVSKMPQLRHSGILVGFCFVCFADFTKKGILSRGGSGGRARGLPASPRRCTLAPHSRWCVTPTAGAWKTPT